MHTYSSTIAGDAQAEISLRSNSALSVARSKFVETTLVLTNLTLGHVFQCWKKVLRQNDIAAQLRAFFIRTCCAHQNHQTQSGAPEQSQLVASCSDL
jgi:hypothetical protein